MQTEEHIPIVPINSDVEDEDYISDEDYEFEDNQEAKFLFEKNIPSRRDAN